MRDRTSMTGAEVARFRIGDSERETAAIEFPNDEAFVRITPEEQGPGFKVLWATEHSAAGFAKDVVGIMKKARVPLMYGGILSGSQQRQHLIWCDTSQEFMQRLPKINTDLVQEFNLYTGCANVQWLRHFSERAIDTERLGARYLASLEVSSDTVRREWNYSRNLGVSKQSSIRDVILECIETTATEPVKQNSGTALKTFARNIPLLRAA